MSGFSDEFRIGDSPTYALFTVLLHGGAGLLLLLTDFARTDSAPGMTLLAVLWLILGLGAISDLRRSGVRRGPLAIARITIADPRRDWRLCQRRGDWFGPAVVTGGQVMDAAIWLQLRDRPGRCRLICIPADALGPELFRRLRVAANAALGR